MTHVTVAINRPAQAAVNSPKLLAGMARSRLLAAFLPVTAVLYAGAEALDPRGTDQVVTSTSVALKLLPIAAAHSSQLYLSGSLSVLALWRPGVSYAAIARLVTGRGWVIATIAALLGGLGAFAGGCAIGCGPHPCSSPSSFSPRSPTPGTTASTPCSTISRRHDGTEAAANSDAGPSGCA